MWPARAQITQSRDGTNTKAQGKPVDKSMFSILIVLGLDNPTFRRPGRCARPPVRLSSIGSLRLQRLGEGRCTSARVTFWQTGSSRGGCRLCRAWCGRPRGWPAAAAPMPGTLPGTCAPPSPLPFPFLKISHGPCGTRLPIMRRSELRPSTRLTTKTRLFADAWSC